MDEQAKILEAKSWDEFLEKVEEAKLELQEAQTQETSIEDKKFWYRGHKRVDYTLTPSLFRYSQSKEQEENLFNLYRRINIKKPKRKKNDWEILFDMQHYGVPTRLLDWTEVLGVAVYFAVTPKSKKPCCIYILDPVKLNNKSELKSIINVPNPRKSFDYQNIYWRKEPFSPYYPIAISPALQKNNRLQQQRGKFTVHSSKRKPLENQCPDCLRKVILLPEALEEACKFLDMANLNAFSLFPDFEGKVNFIKNEAGLEPIPYDETIANKIRTSLEQIIDKDRKILQKLPIGDPGRAKLFIKGISACNIDDSFIRRKKNEQKLATWLKKPGSGKQVMIFALPLLIQTGLFRLGSLLLQDYQKQKSPYIFVFGEAGIGKTNFLLNMLLFNEEFKTQPIVFFSLKSYELEESKKWRLEDFLFQYIFSRKDIFPNPPTEYDRFVAKEMITQGKMILILDGLDELARIKSQDFIQKVYRELTHFIGKSQNAKVIISCRNHILDRLKKSGVLGSEETIVTHEIKKLEELEIKKKFEQLLRGKTEELPNNLVTLAQVPLFYQLMRQILANPKRLTEVVDNRAKLYELWFKMILEEHEYNMSNMPEIVQIAKLILDKRSNFVELKELKDLPYQLIIKLCQRPFNIFVEEGKNRFSFSHQSLREFILAWSAAQEIKDKNFSLLSETSSFDYEGAETYLYLGELIDLQKDLVEQMESILQTQNLDDQPKWNNLARNLFEAVGMLAKSDNSSLTEKVVKYAIRILQKKSYNNIYVSYRTKYNIVRCLERLHPSAPSPYFEWIIDNSYPWDTRVSRNNIPAYAIRGFHLKKPRRGRFPYMIFNKSDDNMEIPDLEIKVSNCLLDIIENLKDEELPQDAEFLKVNCTFALIRWLPQELSQDYQDYINRTINLLTQPNLYQFMTKNICESISKNIYWAWARRYEYIPQELKTRLEYAANTYQEFRDFFENED